MRKIKTKAEFRNGRPDVIVNCTSLFVNWTCPFCHLSFSTVQCMCLNLTQLTLWFLYFSWWIGSIICLHFTHIFSIIDEDILFTF
jgi:hypothetical protein